MKEFYKDFKTFVNESKNGTLNKKSERINEAITYTISKDELKKFMVPATVKLISSLEAGKEMITAQSDNFEAYIVKVIDADTFELKPAMDVFKKKKSENITPEREEGYEEEDDSTNDEELELEEDSEEEVETEDDDDEPKFESFVNEMNRNDFLKGKDLPQNKQALKKALEKGELKMYQEVDGEFKPAPRMEYMLKNWNDFSYSVKHAPNDVAAGQMGKYYYYFINESFVNESKSKEASMVLNLMDHDYSYEDALKIVLKADPSINKSKLEKELDQYI